MKVVLELQDQPSNIKKVTVRHDIVIGRGAECNLRLSAPQVSRRHCFLRVGADGASLTDLDSSNGSWMNGKKLTSGKRYTIDDGAQLAVGPVKFVARVESEVAVGEELQVHLQDERIEAELSAPIDDSSAGFQVDATVADLLPEEDHSDMSFSVEHAGASSGEDEPTADFVATDSRNGLSVDEAEVIDAPELIDEDLAYDVEVVDEPETLAAVDDLINAEVVDVIDVSVDEEVVELIDADDLVEELPEDEVLVVEDDDRLVVDDDEVVLMDDEEIIEASEESASSTASSESGDEADELRDFLKGLD